MELYEWYNNIVDGKINTSRKSIFLIMLDVEENERWRWALRNAWPIKYTPPSLNATENEIAIEVLEIAHEGMIRVK